MRTSRRVLVWAIVAVAAGVAIAFRLGALDRDARQARFERLFAEGQRSQREQIARQAAFESLPVRVIAGRVVDEAGRPIEGARVSWLYD